MDALELIKEKLSKKIKKITEHSDKRIYLEIDKDDIVDAAKAAFFDANCRFAIASGTDTPEAIEILYHFSEDKTGRMISFRVLIKDKKKPEIDSIGKYIKAAEWIEREMWELLGINFKGHPNLTHLLLIDDWPQGEFPLRHDHEHK